MGRNSAGASFLRGYFSYGNPDKFWVYGRTKSEAQIFANIAKNVAGIFDINYIAHNNFAALEQPGNIFFPGPDLNRFAWQRHLVADTSWSLCGITHTTSSAKVMDLIGDYCVAPLRKWDALICTSEAVRTNVEFILESKKQYLRMQFGDLIFEHPKLPVIPLGVNSSDFEFTQSERFHARKKMNISAETIVILYVGRLSFHAKANPLPMYAAIEQAASLSPTKKIKLIECGWYSNKGQENSFAEAADMTLKTVTRSFLDGRDQGKLRLAWQSADIFCSFSDNTQETFGISPVEAMASGLPVVVTDWNGYKESVRDEIDGFRISTFMPGPGFGIDLANSYAIEEDNYDHHIGKSSAFVAIDFAQAVQRFKSLIDSKNLRRKLGNSGKKRVKEKFDWRIIIPQYEKLWFELSNERNNYQGAISETRRWPERPDPFSSFQHYPSRLFNLEDKFSLVDKNIDVSIINFQRIRSLKMFNYLAEVLPKDEELIILLTLINEKQAPIDEIVNKFDKARQAIIFRSIAWLLKVNIVRISR